MSTFDEMEKRLLAENPHLAAPGYTPAAPAAAPTDPELSAADLARAAAYAVSPEGRRDDPHGAEAVWRERVRRAEAEMSAAGEIRPAPSGQSVGGPEPDAKAWAEVNALAAERDPRTNRRYCEANSPEGARARELLDFARNEIFAGRPVPRELIEQARAALKADREAFDRETAEREARELAEFRERQR